MDTPEIIMQGINLVGTAVIGLVAFSFKRGHREADFVTRKELNELEERLSRTYARQDLTSQRFDIIEERIDDVRGDIRNLASVMNGIQETLNQMRRCTSAH